MNAYLTSVLLTGLVMASPLAAQDPALPSTSWLGVFGSVTSASCSPEVTGNIDLGEVNHSMLSPDKVNHLSQQVFKLTITCDQPAKIGFITNDPQRSGVHASEWARGRGQLEAFTLTNAAGDAAVGGYTLGGSQIWLDGVAGIGMTWVSDGFTATRSLIVTPREPVAFKFPGGGAGEPRAFKTLRYDITVTPWLLPSREIRATDAVGIKGAVTFEVVLL